MSIIKKTDAFRAKKTFTDTENVTPSFASVETTARGGGEATRLFNSVFDSTSVTTGMVVYWDSLDGSYKPALANGGNEQAVVGIAKVEDGEVITSGIYEGIVGFSSGDTVYLDSTSPGLLTVIAPTPNTVRIGRVFYHAFKASMCLVVDISNVAGDVFNAVNAENVTNSINSHAISTIFEANGTRAKNATNVTTNINGQAISTIFEVNGTTVKLATDSNKLNNQLPSYYEHAGVIPCTGLTLFQTGATTLSRTVGPTGSGASFIHSAMDAIPIGAKFIWVTLVCQVYAGATGSTHMLARDTAAVNQYIYCYQQHQANYTTTSDSAYGIVPIDANRVFNIYYNAGGALGHNGYFMVHGYFS